MVFVTGATGFLGSYLCLYLVQNGYTIKASKRPHSIIPSILKNVENKIEWIDVDLHNYFELKDALAGCEAIFHCAAQVSFNPKKKKELWKNNVELTSNIVNAALEIENIVLFHISSISAIGEAKPNKQIDENSRWVYKKTESDYAITKFEAEREVWRGIHEGLNAIIVNPSIILGYDERGKGSMGLIHQIENNLKFYTDGTMGFIDVNDVVKCIVSLYEKKIYGERFILSSGNYSFKEVLDTIAKLMHKKGPQIEAKPWMLKIAVFILSIIKNNHPLNKFTARSAFKKSFFSNDKIKQQINFDFIPLEKSIYNMLNKKIV